MNGPPGFAASEAVPSRTKRPDVVTGRAVPGLAPRIAACTAPAAVPGARPAPPDVVPGRAKPVMGRPLLVMGRTAGLEPPLWVASDSGKRGRWAHARAAFQAFVMVHESLYSDALNTINRCYELHSSLVVHAYVHCAAVRHASQPPGVPCWLTAAALVEGRASDVPGRATWATLFSSSSRSATPCVMPHVLPHVRCAAPGQPRRDGPCSRHQSCSSMPRIGSWTTGRPQELAAAAADQATMAADAHTSSSISVSSIQFLSVRARHLRYHAAWEWRGDAAPAVQGTFDRLLPQG